MDAIFPGDPIDYVKQKDLVMSRIDEALGRLLGRGHARQRHRHLPQPAR